MAIGIDLRSTVAVVTGMGGDPFSRREAAACAEVPPPAEHAVVVRVAARASQGENGPTVKRIDQQSGSSSDRRRLHNGQGEAMLIDRWRWCCGIRL
jgi:hypothetical protein